MYYELTEIKESITEVLLELKIERTMLERRMSTGVQASSTGGVQASSLTSQARNISIRCIKKN
jgi:hypothetical protein